MNIPFFTEEAERAIELAGVPAAAVTKLGVLQYIHLRRPDGQFVWGHNGKVYPTTCENVDELVAEIKAAYRRLERSGLLMR